MHDAVAAHGRGAFVDGADLRAVAEGRGWEGLGAGCGRLTGRQVQVALDGKRLPGRRRQARLWLPGPDGRVQEVAPVARRGVGMTVEADGPAAPSVAGREAGPRPA